MKVLRPLKDTGYATAVCSVTDNVGDLVYITGDLIGPDYQVARVDPLNEKMPAVAVIVSKISAARAVIQFDGNVKGIYNTLVAGKTYFASELGRPSLTPPAPTLGGKAYVQPIGVAVDSDVLKLSPSEQMTILRGW